MAMGRRQRQRQQTMWVATEQLPRTAGHVFYEQVNKTLAKHGFDEFAEKACEQFYADRMGRPGLAPGIYFRMQLIGYFEGIDSERGMAWRCADSLSLREFIGVGLTGAVPDHSTVSRTRRLIDLETHGSVFSWVLGVLAENGLVDGKTVGVDGSTLEANAAMKSIVRRDTGESYKEFLEGLAKTSGIETPTREDLAQIDRKRKNKGSNKEWVHPDDPDAAITKMKDGRTHLGHKLEHAVDMKTGAVLAVTVQAANQGDTTTLTGVLIELGAQMETLDSITDKIREDRLSELVTDKGYLSNDTVTPLCAAGVRTYMAERDRGRRQWKNKSAEQKAIYANRRRIRGNRGKDLLRQRGLMLERPFAHCLETGGLRRVHLRGRPNILKRVLVHYAAFNLSLVLRQQIGKGTPRGLQGLVGLHFFVLLLMIRDLEADLRRFDALSMSADRRTLRV
jgi:transposase